MTDPMTYLTTQLQMVPSASPMVQIEFNLYLSGTAEDITCNIVVKTFPGEQWLASSVPFVTGKFDDYTEVLAAIHEAIVLGMGAVSPF